MITIDATGTVTAEFSRTIANGITAYALISVSSDVTLEGGVVIPFSVTATPNSGPGFEDWFLPGNWSDGGLFAIGVAGVQVARLIGDVSDDPDIPAVLPDFSASANALQSLGPTNRALVANIGMMSYGDARFPVTGELDATYDVTIGNDTRMSLDQNDVVVNSLTVAPAGTLLAGSTPFTVDNDLVNNGSLIIASGDGSGSGGTVQGAFDNFGNAVIDGQLNPASINNSGVVSVVGLWLDAVSTTNSGVFEAVAGGILQIGEEVDNTGGTIAALAGSTVDIAFGSTITGGTVEAMAGGTIEAIYGTISGGMVVADTGGTVALGSGGLLNETTLTGGGIFQGVSLFSYPNASGLQDVAVSAGVTYTALASNVTTLQGDIVNAGTLASQGGAFVVDGTVTLSGDGMVALVGGDMSGTADLINADNMISGTGNIETPLDNRSGAVIDANVAGQLGLYAATPSSNAGVFKAEAGGTLVIEEYVDNTGGAITALSGGTVGVFVGTISAGMLVADAGGTVEVGPYSLLADTTLAGSGTFQGVTNSNGTSGSLQDVTLSADATYTAPTGNDTTLQGDLVNAGTLAAQGSGAFVIDGTVTLSGGGMVALVGGGNVLTGAYLGLPGASDLINADNTISGTGNIETPLDNRSGAVIDANVAGQLGLYAATPSSNAGVFEAAAGGILVIEEYVDNTGGAVTALSGGTIDIVFGTISAGVVVTDAGGTIEVGPNGLLLDTTLAGGGTFQGFTNSNGTGGGLQDVTLGADVTYMAGNTTTLQGDIANAGTLGAQGGSFVIDGTVALSGGGTLTLGGGGNVLPGAYLGLPGTSDLINAGNTISGAGNINAQLDNRAGAIVDADTAGQTLQLSAATPSANTGVFEAAAGGTLLIDEYVDNTGGAITALSGGTIDVDGTLAAGTIDAQAGATIQIDARGTIADATLAVPSGATILDNGIIEATAGHTATVNGDITGTGSLLVAGTMELNGAVAPGLQLVFDPGTLILGSPLTMQATIGNFTDGDSIRFAGTYASLTNSFAGGILNVFGDGTQIASLTFAGAYAPPDFLLSQSGGFVTVNTDIPCFAAGTRILTTRGEVAVEALSVGDLAVTRDGTPRPITWIGHRHVDITRHPRPDNALPYRVRRGAFAENQPARDLLLSPDHAVFIDGVLIPVKCLDNGRTIARARVEAIDYYHVELARHDILLAEGLQVESYLDTGNRAMFANAGVAMLLHPELAVANGLKHWEADACAELVTQGPVLLAARRALAARADAFGYRARKDRRGLCIAADGRDIRPCAVNGMRHVFVLPPGAREFRIISPTWVPAEVMESNDCRVLGVAVTRIRLRGGAEEQDLRPDDPALADGWHAMERSARGLSRWTRGDGRVLLPAHRSALVVEIELAAMPEAPREAA